MVDKNSFSLGFTAWRVRLHISIVDYIITLFYQFYVVSVCGLKYNLTVDTQCLIVINYV